MAVWPKLSKKIKSKMLLFSCNIVLVKKKNRHSHKKDCTLSDMCDILKLKLKNLANFCQINAGSSCHKTVSTMYISHQGTANGFLAIAL